VKTNLLLLLTFSQSSGDVVDIDTGSCLLWVLGYS
jgi:hypothetical protein